MPTRDPKALLLIRHESALAGCPPPWPLADLEPLTDPRSWLLPRGLPEAQAGAMRPRQRTPNLAWEGGPSIPADSWPLLCLCCAHAGHCLGSLPPSSPSSAPLPTPPQLVFCLALADLLSALLGRWPGPTSSTIWRTGLGRLPPLPHATIGPCSCPGWVEWGARRQIWRTGPEPATNQLLSWPGISRVSSDQ